MKLLDRTFPTPEENLACDEALLEFCENQNADEILRFWEPSSYFIVLGYSSKIQDDVALHTRNAYEIPVLRRVSGGGTVLQGPGCLNFSLILKLDSHPECKSIVDANCYVMKRQRRAIESLIPAILKTREKVEIAGHTDLLMSSLKFSGNAQRRKRHCFLFHGTFLYDFDIAFVEKTLKIPARQPAYRQNRPHRDFISNIRFSPAEIKKALCLEWEAEESVDQIPEEEIQRLVVSRYALKSWNEKF